MPIRAATLVLGVHCVCVCGAVCVHVLACVLSWSEVRLCKPGCGTAANNYVSRAGAPQGRGIWDSCKQPSGI